MQFIKPNWPAPDNIRAYTTTRLDEDSSSSLGNFNLGKHLGDDIDQVEKNRNLIVSELNLPCQPTWLIQTHGTTVVNIDHEASNSADAAIATSPNRVCVVMTADCLPVLICDKKGTKVAAIHAGWRGLANGILENTIQSLNEEGSNLMAWLGPAIGPSKFEVSEDVLNVFLTKDPQAKLAFVDKVQSPGKWLANIYTLARQRLNTLGLTDVYGGEYCTYTDEKFFYSYRRDQGITGRMATLIWLSA